MFPFTRIARIGALARRAGRLPAAACILTALAAAAFPPSAALAQTVTSASRGAYTSFGTSIGGEANGGYGVGNTSGLELRHFFLFNIPAPTPGQQYVSATLRVFNAAGGYVSPDPTETWNLWDYTGSLSNLTAANGNGSGLAIFADLGGGTAYGSAVLNNDTEGTFIQVPLSSAAVAGINAAAGSGFALGGNVATLDANSNTQESLFLTAAFNPASNSQLILTQGPAASAAPEPGSIALIAVLATPASAVAFRRRRISDRDRG